MHTRNCQKQIRQTLKMVSSEQTTTTTARKTKSHGRNKTQFNQINTTKKRDYCRRGVRGRGKCATETSKVFRGPQSCRKVSKTEICQANKRGLGKCAENLCSSRRRKMTRARANPCRGKPPIVASCGRGTTRCLKAPTYSYAVFFLYIYHFQFL